MNKCEWPYNSENKNIHHVRESGVRFSICTMSHTICNMHFVAVCFRLDIPNSKNFSIHMEFILTLNVHIPKINANTEMSWEFNFDLENFDSAYFCNSVGKLLFTFSFVLKFSPKKLFNSNIMKKYIFHLSMMQLLCQQCLIGSENYIFSSTHYGQGQMNWFKDMSVKVITLALIKIERYRLLQN